jgi:hypothetical protein
MNSPNQEKLQDEKRKKDYKRPELVHYGDIGLITQDMSMVVTNAADGGTGNPKTG